MALSAASKAENITKSLNAYFHTTLVTADSIDVHFPGRREVFVPSGATWVQVFYLLGITRQRFPKVSTADRGSLVNMLINLNCCEQVALRTNRYTFHALRDTTRERVADGTSIDVRDYDTGGDPIVGKIVIDDVTENDVQDGFGVDDNGIAIWNLSVSCRYLESIS